MAERQITNLTGMAEELLPRLSIARNEDAVGDQVRTATGKKAGAFGLGGCLTTVAGFFLLAVFTPLGLLLTLGGIVLLVIAFKESRKKAKLDEYDLDGDRLLLVQELLQVMQPDFSDKKPLTLTLAHGSSVKFGRNTEQRTEGSWLTGRVNFSEYEDPWMVLSGRMQDGAAFRLSVEQCVKRKSKPKRKYTKVTDRMCDEVTLVLRAPAEVYPHLDRLQGVLDPQRLAGHVGMHVSGLAVQDGTVRLKAATGYFTKQVLRYGSPETGQEHKIHSSKIVGLLAFIYAGLSHCRIGAEPTPPAGQAAAAPPPPGTA
jgi:hypothetical protein